MPSEKKSAIPTQDLGSLNEGFPRQAAIKKGMHSSYFKRFFVLCFALGLSIYAIYEMYHVFLLNSLTLLEYIVLILFAINFSWIALGFSYSLAGFFTFFKTAMPDNTESDLNSRNAVVVPIYNESTDRVFALVETMALDLASTPHGHAFDWFILSDSTDPQLVLAEEQAFCMLRDATAGKMNVYYRRRVKNKGHKAGNIEDFCRRWGTAYDHFIVLDADSVMVTSTLIKLAQRMQKDPDAGLMQTLPALINGKTPFALVQQFASRVYGPLLGRGMAWWTQKEGNFWGHNAIIRTEAYMKAAALPILSGPPPFGGAILSHDFVEAALIRRAGWSVIIASDLGGSYEEIPPSIYDMAVRDRRWCQGNLQHSRVIHARGLHWVSRFHLASGILSYLSSPFWLMLIIFGLLLSLQAHYLRPEYFPEKFSLFPTWPVMDFKRALTLFFFTMGVLFGPKILGLILVIFSDSSCKKWGGRLAVFASFITEIILSALIAPIMMLQQTGSVASILFLGKDSSWKPQRRSDGALTHEELFKFHRSHMVCGFILGFTAYLYSWTLLAWVSPALIGLWMSIPLSAFTSSTSMGKKFKDAGILLTPEETDPPKIILDVERRRKEYDLYLEEVWSIRLLLKYPDLMALHLAIIDKLQIHPPGTPVDPLDAVALVKVYEAENQEGLLELLTDTELSYILGQANILYKMAELPSGSN